MTQIKTRDSFILHTDSLVILNKMTNEQAGIFLKAIYKYQLTGELPKLDIVLDMAITPFINQFVRDSQKYQITCERRKKAGAKGGKQKVANASKSKQKVANLADSDNVNDNDSDNVTKKPKGFTKPTLDQIKTYCVERNNSVNPEKWLNHYKSNGWKVGKNKMKDWKAAIRTWENSNFNNNQNDLSKWDKY